MKVANIILQQLGGDRFITMTGSKNFVSDGNTLRMTLTKNKSKANRLYVTLDPNDTYTMRFFRYTPFRLVTNRKTGMLEERPDKVEEVKTFKMVYADKLENIFAQVTGLYTRL